MSDEKIYIGAGKKKTFDGGGESIGVVFKLDGMKEYWEKYGYLSEDGSHMLKMNVNSRREVSANGYTHTVILDTWKPDNADNYEPASNQNQAKNNDNADDDGIPF